MDNLILEGQGASVKAGTGRAWGGRAAPMSPCSPPVLVSSLSPFNHSRWAAAVSGSPAHRLVCATWERRKRKGGREGGGMKGGGRVKREKEEEEKGERVEEERMGWQR